MTTPSGPPQPAAREQARTGPLSEDELRDLLARWRDYLPPAHPTMRLVATIDALRENSDTAPVVAEDETDAKDRARAAEFAWELAAGSPSMQDDARRMLDVEPPIVGSDMGTERETALAGFVKVAVGNKGLWLDASLAVPFARSLIEIMDPAGWTVGPAATPPEPPTTEAQATFDFALRALDAPEKP